MQEKQALAQLRDAQLIVSLSHMAKSESASRPSSVNLADPGWSETEIRPPTVDDPAGAESGWVYFAGVCPAECADAESAAISRLCPLVTVSAGETSDAAGSHAALLKL